MGILISKFRKKKSTLEILDGVEKEITSIEDFRRDTEQAQKRIVGRFIVISVGTYLLFAFTFYFYFFPADFYDQLFYIIPLIFAPVIIITVKRGLTWYYKRKISHKQNKLMELRDKKKKLLDEVKETETYKVAKSILDKYAPENQISSYRTPSENKMQVKTETMPLPDTILRQRALPPPGAAHIASPYGTPRRPVTTNSRVQFQSIQKQAAVGAVEQSFIRAPLPRGILPRDRSVFDKMVDYLMGDGPSNRFALICKACFSHNGMAHKDEFEYVSFRCCYCFTMNEARKKRPGGPKLESDSKSFITQSESSESEKESSSESESETKPHDKIVEQSNREPELIEHVEEIPMEVEEIIDPIVPPQTEQEKDLPIIDLKD